MPSILYMNPRQWKAKDLAPGLSKECYGRDIFSNADNAPVVETITNNTPWTLQIAVDWAI